jgi:molybdopterin-binding protein
MIAAGGPEGLAGRLSARNLISGVVDEVVVRGGEAEVRVRTGGVGWTASVVAETVDALALRPGCPVVLVVKARGCHVVDAGP